MVRLILLGCIFCCTNLLYAQSSDFIILKKKNKTISTFYQGSNISFVTTSGAFRDGLINRIKNDSIFMQEFLVRRIPTTVGTYILDTAGSFRYSYNYHDIKTFAGPEQKKFNVSGSGAALLGGGILLTLASGVVYLADRKKFSSTLMASSAALAVAGYFMSKSGSKGIVIGKRNYHLQYMSVSR